MAVETCPYCGHQSQDPRRCGACGGLFEPMSRQATQLAMGPWYLRDEGKPFMPGFSTAVLKHQAMAGRITKETLLRGPTTHQFWLPAGKVPGVSRLLGVCHACAASVAVHAKNCPKCEADLALPEDDNTLGLEYPTPEARARAQRDLAAARAAGPQVPVRPATSVSGGTPAAARPAVQAAPAASASAAPVSDAAADHDEVYLDAEGHDIEELWDAAPAVPRRRAKRSGPDPLLLGLGVVALVAVFVAAYFAMTAASEKHEEQLGDASTNAPDTGGPATQQPTPPTPPPTVPAPSEEQLAAVLERLLPVMDQLRQTTMPEHLQARFDALDAQVSEAQVLHEAGELRSAYQMYLEADRDAGRLDVDQADHAANMDDLQAAEAAQASAYKARGEAQADEAPRWAPEDWALAEQALAEGEAAIAQARDEPGAALTAYDAFRQALSDYEYARSQASRGFLAVQAGEKLDQAIAASFDLAALEEFGGEAFEEMRLMQERGRGYLAEYAYFDAQDTFEIALLRLSQAERGVKRAYGVKFYAFAAGYVATDALIAVAAGDGLSEAKRELLGEAFDDLSLQTALVDALPAGATPDYSESAQVLVVQAREAIARELGLEAQLSYAVGFQFRIVQQTLDNRRLSAEHTRRISRTLNLIKEQAGQAGYSPELAMLLDQFKDTLQRADDADGLERARAAWRDLIVTLRTYDRAMPIVNPQAGTAPDPELFPGSGN